MRGFAHCGLLRQTLRLVCWGSAVGGMIDIPFYACIGVTVHFMRALHHLTPVVSQPLTTMCRARSRSSCRRRTSKIQSGRCRSRRMAIGSRAIMFLTPSKWPLATMRTRRVNTRVSLRPRANGTWTAPHFISSAARLASSGLSTPAWSTSVPRSRAGPTMRTLAIGCRPLVMFRYCICVVGV